MVFYYSACDEARFRRSVNNALEQVKTILGHAKNPRLAEDEDHTYEDKYALAEYVSNSSIAALLHVLDRFGLDPTKLQTLLKWVVDDKKTVTLSFRAQDSCSFLQETQVDHIPSTELHVETTTEDDSAETNTKTRSTTTTKARVVRKIRLHHWKVGVNYAVAAYPGTDTAAALELQSRDASTVIITSAGMVNEFLGKSSPIPQHTVHDPVEVNITWLLLNLNREAGVCQFAIDRTLKSCKTPRRNDNIDDALDFKRAFAVWANRVKTFFLQRVEEEIISKQTPIGLDPSVRENLLSSSGLNGESIYRPVLPLLENGAVLDPTDTGALLDAHSQSIDQVIDNVVGKMFPPSQLAKLATTAEAKFVLLCDHAQNLVKQYQYSVDYIEGMLTKQIIQAIGKQVKSKDFDKFMRFHNQKLFGPAYAPRPFTHAIRRPNHFPDGILSIESNVDTTDNAIETMVRHVSGKNNPPIYIPINAATKVEITGDRFLHGWIRHEFESEASLQYKLVARARQFCSFMLVVGTMAGKDKFAPKSAIILQNKDEVLIPLLTEVIPTAKEFKDAIASLSPEQQDFAKAYRAMQLESSVFGVCVIQLKPQLECLLRLPDGALTKEIQLTQDLMSLFVDYQIPSDLLSFDGDAGADMATKLAAVKGHVKAVMDVIANAKEKQIADQERKAEIRKAQLEAERQSLEPSPLGVFGSTERSEMFCFTEPSVMYHRSDANYCFGSAPAAASGGAPSFVFSAPSPPQAADAFGAPPSLQAVDEAKADAEMEAEPSVRCEEEKTDGDFELVDDFTMIPKVLDSKVERFDAENALKSTIIKAGPEWTRLRQENLLTKLEETSLSSDKVDSEKNKAFDLLDAVSRSGTLPIACAELHVVVALTHCFEKDVMNTLVQDNVNPIEKLERSALIVGSTIHDELPQILIQGSTNSSRLAGRFPALFMEDE